MLYAITLTYIDSAEKIRDHLDAHKDWLVKNIKSTHVIFAGPLTDESGGFILAYAENLKEIQKMMGEDPFVIYHLVNLDIIEANPAICSADFSRHWTGNAKAI
ncbi:YciI family protein [Pseudomonas coronafaciens]|uniref:YciI family protein n=1 Tax=Pseudomonas coronafaciens TaxID=53409 RepID=UPI000EFE5B00|nr:YciI family protein [Pseudomonas coronafaciens]